MSKSLEQFNSNKDMRDNVHQYLIEFLGNEGLKKMFDKEDVAGYGEAKEAIDKAFENLEDLFTPETIPKDIKNEAR